MSAIGAFLVFGMVLARVWIGVGMGESIGISVLWGFVNVACAAAGGLAAVFLLKR